jgi:hypothetical protein
LLPPLLILSPAATALLLFLRPPSQPFANKSGMPGIGAIDLANLEAQARAELGFWRVACNKEGDGDGGKSDGNKGGGRATATRAMVMEKANNNQPGTGLAKAGGGWRESVDEATTQPRRWATRNNESMRRMMMAATKRARVERAMVLAMRVAFDEEGEGDNKKDGIGDEGGVRRRG